jgi:hypothetical protein
VKVYSQTGLDLAELHDEIGDRLPVLELVRRCLDVAPSANAGDICREFYVAPRDVVNAFIEIRKPMVGEAPKIATWEAEREANPPINHEVPDVELVPCPGEAHSNPFIDHCMLCAPRWGWAEKTKGE